MNLIGTKVSFKLCIIRSNYHLLKGALKIINTCPTNQIHRILTFFI